VQRWGVTVGQSLGEHVVLGSTVGLLHGDGNSRAGVDVGAVAAFNLLHLGVSVRNVTEPTLGNGPQALTLQRQVRAGIAVSSTGQSRFSGAALAMDVDVTRVTGYDGEDERRLAGGVEWWTRSRRLGVRAGGSGSTIGTARSALSAGLSVALRAALYVDGRITGGSDSIRRGWGLAARLTF
jgi:hypothetical protein